MFVVILFLTGCTSEVDELKRKVETHNSEVSYTFKRYKENKELAEKLNDEVEKAIADGSFELSNNYNYSKLSSILSNLKVAYQEAYEEQQFSIEGYVPPNPDEDNEMTDEEIQRSIQLQLEDLQQYSLLDGMDTKYYYDDKSNILEQVFIFLLPNNTKFWLSIEWFKGEIIGHEEMVLP